jgi:D-ribose pyranose/furanose isomerase RbsD
MSDDSNALAIGLSGFGGIYSAYQNNQINQDNLAFQKLMAQNAHQWEVQDLKKAGLNPILSATGGKGAQASGGSQVGIQNPFAGITDALRVASEINKNDATANQANSQKDVNDVLTKKITVEEAKIREEANKVRQEIKNLRSQIGKTLSDTANVKQDTRIKRLQTTMHEVDQLIYSGQYGQALRLLEKPGVAASLGVLGYSVAGYIKTLKILANKTKLANIKAAKEAEKLNKLNRRGRPRVTRGRR